MPEHSNVWCKVCDVEKREANRWLRVYVGRLDALAEALAGARYVGLVVEDDHARDDVIVLVSAFDAALPGDPVCGLEHATILLSRFHGEVVVGKKE